MCCHRVYLLWVLNVLFVRDRCRNVLHPKIRDIRNEDFFIDELSWLSQLQIDKNADCLRHCPTNRGTKGGLGTIDGMVIHANSVFHGLYIELITSLGSPDGWRQTMGSRYYGIVVLVYSLTIKLILFLVM